MERWRDLLYRNTLIQFTEFIESSEITHPVEMDVYKESVATEQNSLCTKREELLSMLKGLKPPTANPSQLYEWRKEMDKIYLAFSK